tara:strand:+ start:1638 stop:2720 length:1083 start_codon:yes stop_codon:yes gene_type:complete
MKHTVLVVDDEPDILDALERLLRRKFNVLKALSGDEGLALLEKNDVQVIISDHRMPEMTGVEFLQKSIAIDDKCIRILLTGYTDIESVIDAINSGQVYRYLTKPWDAVDLLNTIEKAVEKLHLRSELEIKNKELQKALAELKTLDQAKSNFMLLMNHELKTPLTVMTSYSELLEESHLDESQQKAVLRIQQSIERLTKLVDDSLTMIQADTKTLKVNPSKVELKSLIDAELEKRHYQISDNQFKISFDFDKATIESDLTHATSIIERIVDNALKFADPHSSIEFKFDKDESRFSITNTGKPFPAEKTEELIRPFTIDEKAMNHSTGTGMGLAIVGALCRSLEIHLEIVPDDNTTTIVLKF